MQSLQLDPHPVQCFPDDESWWDLATRDGTPADPPGEPLLSFPDWIAVHAAYFRSLGTRTGDWLAREIDDLAATARALGAMTTDQFDRRRAGPEPSEGILQ